MEHVLTIITINFNNCIGLNKTIQSVIGQSCRNVEFVVIDGGSTDKSKELIEEHQNSISYSISEKDNGIYDAMNKGIQRSNGKYLLFLNSGDYLNDTNVLGQVFPLLNSEKDIIACSYKMEGSNAVEESPKEPTFSSFWYKSICHQAVLIKKDLFVKYGLYDTSLKIVADWEFFVKAIFLNHATYQCVDIDLVTIENGGLSSSIEGHKAAQAERKLIYNKLFPGFVLDYEQLHWHRSNRLHKIAAKVNRLFGKKVASILKLF